MSERWGDTPELLAVFREEAAERLSSLDDGLLALERDPADAEVLERIRRDAHSIKGSAKLLGFDLVSGVAHRMEDLLLAVSARSVQMSPSVMDALLAGSDTLRDLVADPDDGPDPAPVLAVLEEHLTADAAVSEVAAGAVVQDAGEAGGAESDVTDGGVPRMAVIDLGGDAGEPGGETASTPSGDDESATATGTSRQQAGGFVRLDAAKVYALVDAVGEAVVGHAGIEEAAIRLSALTRTFDSTVRRLTVENVRSEELLEYVRSVREELAGLVTDVSEAVDESRKRMELVQAAGGRLAMLPTSHLFSPLPRLVRDLSRTQGKEGDLEIDEADAELDKQVMERIAEPVRALIINAVDHGIESAAERVAQGKPRRARVILRARQQGGQVAIEVEDDGRGIDPGRVHEKAVLAGLAEPDEPLDRADMVRLLFSPGFSTATDVTDVSGRGVGLDIVRDSVDALRGGIELETAPGQGTRFILTLPTTMAIMEGVLVRVGGGLVTIPVTAVDEVLGVPEGDIRDVAGRHAIVLRDQVLTLVSLGEILGIPADEGVADVPGADTDPGTDPEGVPVVVLSHSGRSAAFRVDALSGRREIMLKELGTFLGHVTHVAGATILGDGSVVPVVDPASVLEAVRKVEKGAARVPRAPSPAGSRRILVVDDSRPIREMLSSILEGAGFDVTLASDGVEAVATLQSQRFDAVVTDVEMPQMNGLDLCRHVRGAHGDLPVVVLTSRAEDEQRREGMEAGADAYMTKNEFDQATFVGLLRTLVG
ncbi:MAG: response regulator [Acidimicrobiia bacterium]|nr:response regulator [Acidimicrobiia bacterium]